MIQIIGFKNCKETQKAIRYFKERRIDFAFVDLKEYKLSSKEWDSIFNAKNSFFASDSQYYKKNSYQYRDYDEREEVMAHIELLKTPVLRAKTNAAIGLDTDFVEKYKC